MNTSFEGPCKEPGCTRGNHSRFGYCNTHAISRVYQGRRPRGVRLSNPGPFHGPCRLWGCLRRCTGPHGLCSWHARHPGLEVVAETRRAVEEALTDSVLARLPERLATVIRWRWRDRLTLEECGQRLGVTRERARQLENSGLDLATCAAHLKETKPRGRNRYHGPCRRFGCPGRTQSWMGTCKAHYRRAEAQ